MKCTIDYIENTPLSNTEKQRLTQLHLDIFRRAKESGFFRSFNDKLYSLKQQYGKALEFINIVNEDYEDKIATLPKDQNGNYLNVDVLPLSSEKQGELFFNKNAPDVTYSLKSVQILQTPKADEVFRKGDKNNWSIEKIMQELAIPKEQQELIKSFNTRNREEILTSLLANYSYTVEINTTKTKEKQDSEFIKYDEESKKSKPTQYYSNLTVPGGTNYTENEIATPAITPSIKGHAQFATDNGIGWFRSDDKAKLDNKYPTTFTSGTETWTRKNGIWYSKDEYGENKRDDLTDDDVLAIYENQYGNRDYKANMLTDSKTRRILEVQSDLFQKGRDKKDLVTTTRMLGVGQAYSNLSSFTIDGIYYYSGMGIAMAEPEDGSANSKKISFKEYEEAKAKWINKNSKQESKENAFLQLLNKNNNWVTFFVKSIIQDSAKKGYEKVLFPTGNTASKVEGHTTLEEFKKQKEDRINKLGKQADSLDNLNIVETGYGGFTIKDKDGFTPEARYRLNDIFDAKEEAQKRINEELEDIEYEVNQIKDEIYRIETEGFGALRPIFNFYENTVTNILKKNFKINKVTDEYGNTWNEIEITPEVKNQVILLQKQGIKQSSASPETLKLIKDFINKIGVNLETLKEITVNGKKYDANGVANLMQGLIQVVEGKETSVLPEEAMHFAVAIVKQKDPTLYKQLLSEINNYQIKNEVFATYGNDPNYQIDGKPNVIKLKEEAIGKLLAEIIINKAENIQESPEKIAKIQSLWDKIVQFLKNLFSKSGFDTLAMKIIKGEDIGTAEDIKEKEGEILLQKNKQEEIYNSLKNTASQIEKKEESYFINDKKIPRRVTDLVKDWSDTMFRDQKLLQTEYDKLVNELKAKKGTAGHADLEHAFKLFIDENGNVRETELSDEGYVSQINPNDPTFYNTLKNNLRKRIKEIENKNPGTKFLSEITIYDPKRGLAGTIDFLTVSPEGSINILDWKFVNLNTDRYEDIPWYKIDAWRQQMLQYKLILEKAYNIKNNQFEQTRMIPIQASYMFGDRKKEELPRLVGIKIGDTEIKNIEDPYLIPVSLKEETTGEEELDKLLEKLNNLYDKLKDKKAPKDEKKDKAQQMNSLFLAIRMLQMKRDLQPLIIQAKLLNEDVKKIIDTYNTEWKDKKDPSDAEMEEFSYNIQIAEEALELYKEIDTDLDFLFESDSENPFKKQIQETANTARVFGKKLDTISQQFVRDFVSKREKVEGILNAEKQIKGLSKWFGTTSTLQSKALETLFKKVNRVLTYAQMDTISETQKLQSIKDGYDKWAQNKGLTTNNYFDILKKKDKNELIDQYNPEFYKKVKEAIKNKDIKWVKENIDTEQYKTQLEEKKKQLLERLEARYGEGAVEENSSKLAKEKFKINLLYDTKEQGWFIEDLLKKNPDKEKWESKEFKELSKKENKQAKDFYEYIIERNKFYASIGYINFRQARLFLPFVRKGLIERVMTGDKLSIGEQFLRNISVDESDIGYGKVDPITGKLIDSLPIYLTRDPGTETSTDLFRTMALYNELAIKYGYLDSIDSTVNQLLRVERNKKAIRTSFVGRTVYKDNKLELINDNSENSQLLEDMIKATIYGQKYIQSETFDQLLGNLGSWGEKINEKLGVKLMPENLEGRQLSVNKIIDLLNNTFSLNALGIPNLLSPLSNLFGGTAQSVINAGTYFTKTDFATAEAWILQNKMGGKDNKKMIAALEYFLPLTENYNKEIAKLLTINKLSAENIQEFIMILMKKSDYTVQTINFFAFLNNSIVQDGKVVNAREYLKTTPEFENMFTGIAKEREQLKSKFETEVKKLIDEKGILNISKLEKDKLVIPGVDRKSDSIVELRRKVQKLSKDALGNLTEDDLRKINLSIYGKSAMIFKNWIPRPVDVRLGNLKYNSSSDAYEWGRMRMIFRLLSTDFVKSIDSLKKAIGGDKEAWVNQVKELYDNKKDEYEKDTGKELNMNSSQFVEMVNQNIKNQLVDVIFLATLMAIYFTLKANAPEDDEDPRVKNGYKFMLRAADKLSDELLYFYNLTSFTSLVSSGIFPAMSYINNFKKLLSNFMIENYAIAIGDEKLEKENQVIKYLLKSFPMISQTSGYLPLISPELAKELGVKPLSQARPLGM